MGNCGGRQTGEGKEWRRRMQPRKQAKALGEWLRARYVDVPEVFL